MEQRVEFSREGELPEVLGGSSRTMTNLGRNPTEVAACKPVPAVRWKIPTNHLVGLFIEITFQNNNKNGESKNNPLQKFHLLYMNAA